MDDGFIDTAIPRASRSATARDVRQGDCNAGALVKFFYVGNDSGNSYKVVWTLPDCATLA